jgi:Ferroportin1 (FPN1)
MYVVQNAALGTASLAALLLLAWPAHGWRFALLVGVTILGGSLSSVGSAGSTVAVEREWTKAMSRGDSGVLARLNAGAADVRRSCPRQLLARHSCPAAEKSVAAGNWHMNWRCIGGGGAASSGT